MQKEAYESDTSVDCQKNSILKSDLRIQNVGALLLMRKFRQFRSKVFIECMLSVRHFTSCHVPVCCILIPHAILKKKKNIFTYEESDAYKGQIIFHDHTSID